MTNSFKTVKKPVSGGLVIDILISCILIVVASCSNASKDKDPFHERSEDQC